jgi:hypothetical protein
MLKTGATVRRQGGPGLKLLFLYHEVGPNGTVYSIIGLNNAE